MCTSLFVDVIKCCRIVRGHLHCDASNEWFKDVESFENRKQFKVVDMQTFLIRGPGCMNLQICAPNNRGGIGCNLSNQLERCKRSAKKVVGRSDSPN